MDRPANSFCANLSSLSYSHNLVMLSSNDCLIKNIRSWIEANEKMWFIVNGQIIRNRILGVFLICFEDLWKKFWLLFWKIIISTQSQHWECTRVKSYQSVLQQKELMFEDTLILLEMSSYQTLYHNIPYKTIYLH